VWNTWRQTAAFTDDKPWLLRFFDQIRFFSVSHDELTDWRRDFPLGRRKIVIEPATFRLKDHRAFLAANATSIADFEARREGAFRAERAAWERDGEFDRVEALSAAPQDTVDASAIVAPDGSDLVEAPLGGSLWKMHVVVGAAVAKGEAIAVIEAMKAEVAIHSPAAGVITAVYAREGQPVAPGAALVALAAAP
jgi:urea carboxylase